MLIPGKIETIKKYTVPKEIVYDPKENFAMAKFLKYKKASFPGIYTLRYKKPIWEMEKINKLFNELCNKITLPSFLAWKELGENGWHIHLYGPSYNFKNIWKGYVTYKKLEKPDLLNDRYKIYNSYFFKLGKENVFSLLGKYGLNEPKFYFRWWGETYFQINGKWVSDKFCEPPTIDKLLKKKSTLYIDLKLVLSFKGQAFLSKRKFVKDSMRYIITLLEAYAFKRRKVCTAIMYAVGNELKVELYMPSKNIYTSKIVIEKLKWFMLKIFGTVCEFINVVCYKTKYSKSNNFLYRLYNKQFGTEVITVASTYKPDFNSVPNLLRLLGKECQNYFCIYLKCKNFKLEGGRQMMREIRRELFGKMFYHNLKYCEIIVGHFKNSDFKNFIEEFSAYHPIMKYRFSDLGFMPLNYTKALKGNLG